MISTVTTSTVTTVTTVALALSVSLVAIITLLALLIQKEVLTASDSPRGRTLSRVLNIAIAPLLLAFLLIAVVQVSNVLR